jgi:hypothetical protein
MRPVIAFAAGAVVLAMSSPGVAQDFKLKADLFGQKTPAPKPPKVDWNWRPSPMQAEAARPAVVCGMTVVPADPKIDPKIRVTPPDTGVRFAMKVVEPTVCTPPPQR